jgi:hypothetical protein
MNNEERILIEKIGHVKNPLTVIAIFAGLAELSGTAVLPFIGTENQYTYIWFLMLFPAYLISLFFIILYLRHEVLYAPSDYKDEKDFQNSLEQQLLRNVKRKSKILLRKSQYL